MRVTQQQITHDKTLYEQIKKYQAEHKIGMREAYEHFGITEKHVWDSLGRRLRNAGYEWDQISMSMVLKTPSSTMAPQHMTNTIATIDTNNDITTTANVVSNNMPVDSNSTHTRESTTIPIDTNRNNMTPQYKNPDRHTKKRIPVPLDEETLELLYKKKKPYQTITDLLTEAVYEYARR